jgi:hypothetical protein
LERQRSSFLSREPVFEVGSTLECVGAAVLDEPVRGVLLTDCACAVTAKAAVASRRKLLYVFMT